LNDLRSEPQCGAAVWEELTVAVPVYSRPDELLQLLASIVEMSTLPGELLLCEDRSPDRRLLASIAAEWKPRLAKRGCVLAYVENAENLGYDANVRKLFECATRRWVMLLGNDDAMLPDAVVSMQRFVAAHPSLHFVSRTFVRFTRHLSDASVVTRIADHDRVFSSANAEPGIILRLCGFVGGLLVDRLWAVGLSTNRYDGTLFYQIYLSAHAFATGGIGYIAAPTVGGRAGNAPLFGAAAAEVGDHKPGSYSPKARASMWSGIIRIVADVERETSVPILRSIRRELTVRQSFHAFELVAPQGRRATIAFSGELRRLGLMGHPLPWTLSAFGVAFGRRSAVFFDAFRWVQRKWWARRMGIQSQHMENR
jgi:abequosyltransferase